MKAVRVRDLCRRAIGKAERAVFCGNRKTRPIEGRPDPKHISTSYVERSNLTHRKLIEAAAAHAGLSQGDREFRGEGRGARTRLSRAFTPGASFA